MTDSDKTIIQPSLPEDKDFGKYKILSILGEGAMGVVYKAEDTLIKRPVAIKTIKKDIFEQSHRDDVLARFRTEAQAAGRLQHAGITALYDYSETDELAYLVMEFVEGRKLTDLINNNEISSRQQAIDITVQLLEALQFAHDNGVVHRDIKPDNILIKSNNQLKIADFGIAHLDTSDLTQVGDVMGTPSFMSPEQCLGKPVDHRTDLFSVGAVLYFMITGQKPFQGDTSASVINNLINNEPVKPSKVKATLDKHFDAIITRAMHKAPEKRFQNAREFIDAIRPLVSKQESTPHRPGNNKSGKIVVAAILLVGIAVIGTIFFGKTPKETPDSSAVPTASITSQNKPLAKAEIKPETETKTNRETMVSTVEPEPSLENDLAPATTTKHSTPTKDSKPFFGLDIQPAEHTDSTYTVGETVSAVIRLKEPAFVYCFYRDYQGTVMRIFPHRFTSSNFLAKDSALQLPDKEAPFDIVMEKAGSQEELLCAATPHPFAADNAIIAKGDLVDLETSLNEVAVELEKNGAETILLKFTANP